jgi:hypothetical protein
MAGAFVAGPGRRAMKRNGSLNFPPLPVKQEVLEDF